MLQEMVCEFTTDCDLTFGALNCNLPKNTIGVGLMTHTLWGIYNYKKDRRSQVSKYSPWANYANRSYQPRTKATATRRTNLVTLTRPNTEKLSHLLKVNVGSFPLATQRLLPKVKPKTWLATLRAQELEATAKREIHASNKQVRVPAD